MGSVGNGAAVAMHEHGRELVVAHCRLVFESGVGKAKHELFQASFNISRVIGIGRPEKELQHLLDELQRGIRMLALLSSMAAKSEC